MADEYNSLLTTVVKNQTDVDRLNKETWIVDARPETIITGPTTRGI